MTCPICSWFQDNPEYLFLGETKYWRICLAPNQSLLGRCAIHLKRHAGDLVNLTEEEILEFSRVIQSVEYSVKSAFEATMFNWSCYMNHSYRENPPDPHIHWWAVPRYNHPVQFNGWVFEDPHFGNPYDHHRWLEVPQDVRVKIAEKIREKMLFPEE